jgi:hypothetical protein
MPWGDVWPVLIPPTIPVVDTFRQGTVTFPARITEADIRALEQRIYALEKLCQAILVMRELERKINGEEPLTAADLREHPE